MSICGSINLYTLRAQILGKRKMKLTEMTMQGGHQIKQSCREKIFQEVEIFRTNQIH